ncbi:MAG: FkbM family methyltransferase, partial [Bacteroidota bacterium]
AGPSPTLHLLMRARSVRLPNGLNVRCHRPQDALMMYQEVADYVRHGLELHPGSTILDVGANLGIFSIWAYEHCESKARILAFEPLAENFELLVQNLQLLEDTEVQAFSHGLGQSEAELEFTYFPQASYASTAYPETPSKQQHLTLTLLRQNLPNLPQPLPWLTRLPSFVREVLLLGLARFINTQRRTKGQIRPLSRVIAEQELGQIDFLKIDVERAEWDVLMGIEEGDWPKIQQLFIEVHDQAGKLSRIQELLSQQGFRHVVAVQDDFFQGTDIHALYAKRGKKSGDTLD